jgi:DNA mismatch endonuclease (patch repair protein)
MSPTKQGSVAAELNATSRKPPASTPGTQKSMRANRRTGTKPELALRKELHCRGLRFRKDFPIRLDGAWARPDIVFTRAKVAVFLDGCWWHGCSEHGMRPRRNAAFWNDKIDETIRRDHRVTAALTDAGWIVIRVWEHEPIADAAKRIERAVRRTHRLHLS